MRPPCSEAKADALFVSISVFLSSRMICSTVFFFDLCSLCTWYYDVLWCLLKSGSCKKSGTACPPQRIRTDCGRSLASPSVLANLCPWCGSACTNCNWSHNSAARYVRTCCDLLLCCGLVIFGLDCLSFRFLDWQTMVVPCFFHVVSMQLTKVMRCSTSWTSPVFTVFPIREAICLAQASTMAMHFACARSLSGFLTAVRIDGLEARLPAWKQSVKPPDTEPAAGACMVAVRQLSSQDDQNRSKQMYSSSAE